jgi:hypothetical protein
MGGCMLLLKILLGSLFIYGCAPNVNIPTRFSVEQLSPTLDSIIGLDQINCDKLRNKKIKIIINSNLSEAVFLENIKGNIPFRALEINKTEYSGSIARDLKNKLTTVLSQCCGSVITENEPVDIFIQPNVNKFYSQIVDAKREGDTQIMSPGEEKDFKLFTTTNSILKIDTNINNEVFMFEHLLTLKEEYDCKTNWTSSGEGAYLNDTLNSLTIKDNKMVLSRYIASNTTRVHGGRNREHFGKLTIFDPMGNSKQELIFSNNDVNNPRVGILYLGKGGEYIVDKKMRGYRELYFSGYGNLKLLMYDYITELVNILNNRAP